MAIAKKPNRSLDNVGKPDPMAFIQGAEHSQTKTRPRATQAQAQGACPHPVRRAYARAG